MDANSNVYNMGIYSEMQSIYNLMNNFFMSPVVLVILAVIFITYVIIFFSLGKSITDQSINSENSAPESNNMFMIFIILFIVVAFIYAFQHSFFYNLFEKMKSLFIYQPKLDIETDNNQDGIPYEMLGKQVFNIPGNTYDYENAKAICAAYNGRLATYKEIENSYNNGGEWCNYGWSEGQMALFPTQEATFNELQKIPKHENDCGRPGVNGGYIANPAVRFGVNCFGNKPRMTPQEEDLMATVPHYPRTENDVAMEKKVSHWQNNLSQILVSPFNYNTWSRFIFH